ncbi:MAG: penicillin-binding protein 2 [Oxalobacter sp.]|nr:penicillin-binding protein 2 [Oxalobacter sp.]
MANPGNNDKNMHQFRNRIVALGIFVLVCFLILLIRFVWLQVVSYDKYAAKAEDNRVTIVPTMPERGLILDRNGVVLASNYSAYTLEITPAKIEGKLEEVIDKLATFIDISDLDRKRFKRRMEESKRYDSVILKSKLSDQEVARFIVQRFRFPGVEVQARTFRQYPMGQVASHAIGYISRMSQRDIDNLDEDEAQNYIGTTHYGKEGIEQSYERILHGVTGYEKMEVSASGRAVRLLESRPTVPGSNIVLSIDIGLQKTVEQAFGNRRGALVALEPSTGEVLAYVSKPTFDPNLFVDGIDHQNWDALNNSPNRPLLNRPIRGAYPPGSTYKPFMAMGALELKYRTPEQGISDPGYFQYGDHKFRDDAKRGHGYVTMYNSIVVSCDTYYYILARDMGVDVIHDFMMQFGFGQKTGIDLVGERAGVLPSKEWKRNAYKKPSQQEWYSGETISLGIGQGYNTFTPVQMAFATALLSNNGVAARPHLVKEIEDPVTHERKPVTTETIHLDHMKQAHFEFIKRAMVGVARGGTGRKVFGGAPYSTGGKTGTAQVFTVAQDRSYKSYYLSEFKRDHALYIAFAPADKPRIAVAVIVENAGFGADSAAPIARRALDYFMAGKTNGSAGAGAGGASGKGKAKKPAEDGTPPSDTPGDNQQQQAPATAPATAPKEEKKQEK